jgi:hypothetical protein
VGEPFKLRVGHDNKGLGAAWHLDRIELHDLASEAVYFFVANRWLAKNEADGQIVVELPLTRAQKTERGKTVEVAGKEALVTYKVTVQCLCVCVRVCDSLSLSLSLSLFLSISLFLSFLLSASFFGRAFPCFSSCLCDLLSLTLPRWR